MIYTFGDGFAAGHIWPEWPQILQAVSTEPVENYGFTGAGNDFIFSTAFEVAMNAESRSTFIIQWAPWRRFDKLLEDDSWHDIVRNDKKYSHTTFNVKDKLWWLSSGSTQLIEYHSKYQQQQQKQLFDIYHMVLLYNFLITHGHKCFYCLTYDFDINKLTHPQLELINQLPWVNGLSGMDSIINANERGTEIQPLPLGHANWLLNLPVDSIDRAKLLRIIEEISKYQWIPFDPDREEKWSQMIKKLS